MAASNLTDYLTSNNAIDFSIVNKHLQSDTIGVSELNLLIDSPQIDKEIREILKQYRILKTAPLNDFLSKSYQQKNNNNLMVIAARSYLPLLKEHLQKLKDNHSMSSLDLIINSQNIDGNTPILFAFNNAERIMSSIKKTPIDSQQLDVTSEIIEILISNGADTLIPNKEGKPAIETCIYCAGMLKKDAKLRIVSKFSTQDQILISYHNHFEFIYHKIVNQEYEKLKRYDAPNITSNLRHILINCNFNEDQLTTIALTASAKGRPNEFLTVMAYQKLFREMFLARFSRFENSDDLIHQIAKSGYLSLFVDIFDQLLTKNMLEIKDVNGNTPLHNALENPLNIEMVRFLLNKNVNISAGNNQYITPYSIIKKYASDPTIAYQKGYQKLESEYNPKSTYLDLLPKTLLDLVYKYLYFNPLPILEYQELPSHIRVRYPDYIRNSYMPVTIPLTKERDLPYVQKLGGYSYYLQSSELDTENINNPTYQQIDQKRKYQGRTLYYFLHSQFVDPRHEYNHLFVRIHRVFQSEITDDHDHLLFVKEIDLLSPSEFIDTSPYDFYEGFQEIIGWRIVEELDLTKDILDRALVEPRARQIRESYLFKIGGFDTYSNGKCNDYEYFNIPRLDDQLALTITDQKCISNKK